MAVTLLPCLANTSVWVTIVPSTASRADALAVYLRQPIRRERRHDNH